MQVSVTFKNLDPSEHLKAYATEKLNRFDKYFDHPAEANVVLSVEKFRHIADINIIAGKFNMNGQEETNDMYSAIDMVLDKLKKQIKKNQQKVKDHRSGSKNKNKEASFVDDFRDNDEVNKSVIIEDMEYKPMDIEEAVMQMDITTDNFIVFLNAKSSKINVLYRKDDKNYGLIQPK